MKAQQAALAAWLDHLQRVFPITGVVHVGAGGGEALARYQEWEAPAAAFIEADEGLHERLAAALKGRAGWSSHCALIGRREEETDFYLATNPGESGIIRPESLAGVWRNLKTREQRRLRARPLDAVLASAGAAAPAYNWLVIDCLPAAPVVQGAGAILESADVVVARVLLAVGELKGTGAAKQEVDAILSRHDYRCVAWEEERQPAVGRALYVRDWKAALRKGVAALEDAAKRAATSHDAAIQALANEHDEERRRFAREQEGAKARLDQAQAKLEALAKARETADGQAAALAKARDESERQARERQVEIERLHAERKTHGGVEELHRATMDRLDKLEKSTRITLRNALLNSTRQIESFIGIDTYLSRGEMLPMMHGWQVSPDLSLYLIELIETRHYDLIVEFGSGASTVLMATALLKQAQRHAAHHFQQLADAGGYGPRQITHGIAAGDTGRDVATTATAQFLPGPADLTPRIVSFEHHAEYFDRTLQKLRQAGVAELVELNHAPLRDYVAADGERFLYYACEERLAALAAMLAGRKARLLVLVDGPPGTTGKHARYPAMPILLHYLAQHRLDVLLDDFIRDEEKEIVDRWIAMLTQRSIPHQHEVLAFEKGASLLSIH